MKLLCINFSRYAEGSGLAAKFNKIRAFAFLFTTKLIIADGRNDCLRLIDFTNNPPSTTRFAGQCKTSGFVEGHRLNDAILAFPTSLALGSNNSIVYFVDNSKNNVRKINLESDEVTLVNTFSEQLQELLFYNNALYATLNSVKVTKINVETSNDEIIAGDVTGKTTGLLLETRFNYAREFICWPDAQQEIFLVADTNNERFDKIFNQICYLTTKQTFLSN